MQKIYHRFLALLLALLLTGCGAAESSSQPADSGNAEVSGDALPQETDAELEPVVEVWAALPDTTLDGYAFRCLESPSDSATGIKVAHGAVEELTGEAINDAIYNRNKAVEETFDVVISTVQDSGGNITTTVRNAVSAGDDSYDLVMTTPDQLLTQTLANALLNLSSIEHINLSNSWYNQEQVQNFQVDGKLYSLMGDLVYSTFLFGAAMVYNVNLGTELNLPDLHEIVMEGNWTLDTMYNHTASAAADLDGDGNFTEENDRFGFAIRANSNLMNFQFCAGERFIEYDSVSGTFTDIFNLEKMQTIVDKVYALYNDNHRTILAKDYISLFNSGRLMLRTTYIGAMFEHQDMEDEFIPVPYPKYDENQEKYHSMMTASVVLMGMPKTLVNKDGAGLIVEALSEYSAGELQNTVYDKVLSYQTMRDERSLDVLKLLKDGLLIDFGYLTDSNSLLRFIVGDVVGSGSTALASQYEKKQKAMSKYYENLIEDFKALD